MKLVGELKDKVEKAENQEEAKEISKESGMELTDEEMNQVAGGGDDQEVTCIPSGPRSF